MTCFYVDLPKKHNNCFFPSKIHSFTKEELCVLDVWIGGNTGNPTVLQKNQELVRNYLAGAARVLEDDGEFHLAIKTGGAYDAWDVKKLFEDFKLSVATHRPVDKSQFPGYVHRLTKGAQGKLQKVKDKGTELYVLEPAGDASESKELMRLNATAFLHVAPDILAEREAELKHEHERELAAALQRMTDEKTIELWNRDESHAKRCKSLEDELSCKLKDEVAACEKNLSSKYERELIERDESHSAALAEREERFKREQSALEAKLPLTDDAIEAILCKALGGLRRGDSVNVLDLRRRCFDADKLPDPKSLNRVLYGLQAKNLVASGPPVNGRKAKKPTWTLVARRLV